MEKEGYVKLYRIILESSVFKNPFYFKVWCWCLLKACHTTQKFPFNNKDILLKPGQFITGLYQAAKEIYPQKRNPSLQSIRSAWGYLKSTNRINIKSTNKFSIITIINWPKFQGYDKKLTNKNNEIQQTNNKPVTTYKNDKNEKNNNLFNKLKSLPIGELKELKQTIMDDDIEIVEVDNEGNPREPKRKGPPLNKQAFYLQRLFMNICQKEIKQRPMYNKTGYFLALKALKEIGLERTEELIKDWFNEPRPDSDLIQITRCLSAININKFKTTL